MDYYEWRDKQWVEELERVTDVVVGILGRIPGARPNRAHVRADIDEGHFSEDPDLRLSEERLIERLIIDANGSIPIDDAYDLVANDLLAIFPLDY